jgi:DNA-binding beta-propeller fold protein YncE
MAATLVRVGLGAEGSDVSPDGKELWTARPDGHIIVLDVDKKAIKADINSTVEGLHRLKFTASRKAVCVVSVRTGDVLFYDAQTRKLEKQMKSGRGAGIYIDKVSNNMFIACTPDNFIAVADLATRKEIKRINIGRPDGITSVIVKYDPVLDFAPATFGHAGLRIISTIILQLSIFPSFSCAAQTFSRVNPNK